jgi:hypothetical protein
MFDDWAKSALSKYRAGMSDSLAEAIPTQLSRQADKGVLSSSLTERVLQNVTGDIYKDFADKAFEAETRSVELKSRLPELFASVMDLGRYSSASSSSKSSSSQSSWQHYEDPVSIYGVIANTLT